MDEVNTGRSGNERTGYRRSGNRLFFFFFFFFEGGSDMQFPILIVCRKRAEPNLDSLTHVELFVYLFILCIVIFIVYLIKLADTIKYAITLLSLIEIRFSEYYQY